MAKQKGRTFLLKIKNGAEFVPFGGMTSKSMSINGERIDATTPDPATPEGKMWRETLDGTRSVSASGDVTLVDDAAEKRAVAIAMAADNVGEFQILVPSIGTFTGLFSLDLEFGDDGKVTASISLESSGEIVFAAAGSTA